MGRVTSYFKICNKYKSSWWRDTGFLIWANSAPEMVFVWIPLMKELGVSWTEIKNATRLELLGLVQGLSNYNVLHAFDGYSSKDIDSMAKGNPSVRGDYAKSQEMKAKYGMLRKHTSFTDLIG